MISANNWLTSGVHAAAAASAEAAREATAKAKERREAIGMLKKRPATIPRGPDELNGILSQYLDQKMTPSGLRPTRRRVSRRRSNICASGCTR